MSRRYYAMFCTWGYDPKLSLDDYAKDTNAGISIHSFRTMADRSDWIYRHRNEKIGDLPMATEINSLWAMRLSRHIQQH